MTPERRQKVENIFQTALDLPAEKRASYLSEVCGGDLTLREEVVSLLATHETGEDSFEDLVPAEVRNWCDVTTRVEFGMPYRLILRVLGKEKPDLLVMNIHGKGMMERALIGSTAERIVRSAKCPVLLIPPIKKTKTAGKPRTSRRAA